MNNSAFPSSSYLSPTRALENHFAHVLYSFAQSKLVFQFSVGDGSGLYQLHVSLGRGRAHANLSGGYSRTNLGGGGVVGDILVLTRMGTTSMGTFSC